jgi:hypothetical protein
MANAQASREFHVSKVAENAMYLFDIGSGALFAGPLSETVGRNLTCLISTFLGVRVGFNPCNYASSLLAGHVTCASSTARSVCTPYNPGNTNAKKLG